MNEIATPPAPETPAAARPWRVFRMTEYEWWLGQSKDEVIRSYVETQCCSLEDCKHYGLLDPDEVVELSDAELERLVFTEHRGRGQAPVKRTFAEELRRVLAEDKPEFPLFFYETEI